ncbi:MAG: hypothetical protein R3C68_13640 [Myxococcota bacterium]
MDDGVFAGAPDSVTFHFFLTGAEQLQAQDTEVLRAEIDDMASPLGRTLTR